MKIRGKIFFCLLFSLFLLCTKSEAKTDLRIYLSGVNKPITQTLLANLKILQEEEDFTADPTLMEQFPQHAQQQILLTLQSLGYYNAQVQTNLKHENEHWKATFQIELGPPTRISELHFHLLGDGEQDPIFRGVFWLFPLRKGDILNHELYEQGKKALLSKAIAAGYLNAMFSEHRIAVNIDENTCVIVLTLVTGQRHYFGPITFETTTLSSDFLRRYLSFAPGDIYSPEKISRLQGQLAQSDYFSQVNVKPLTEDNTAVVPILVELKDAKPNQYVIGGGYGTDTGLRGKVGWTRRQVNSRGHRFSALVRVAEIYNKIELNYSIPGKHPNTDQTKLTAGHFDDEYSEKPSKVYETGITEERTFNEWERRLSLNYLHEQFNAFMTNDEVEARSIMPSITFIRTKRDDIAAPSRGSRIELNLKGSIDALLSNTGFFQAYLQLKWLRAFNDSIKLLTRAEIGATFPNNIERLPLSQRFFAGGDLSLRGYGYRSLPSEIDKNGNFHPVGGLYLAVGSIELVKTIKKPFGVSTFVDAGNAFRLDDNEIAIGVGVGIEWQTRLGPLKFAIAKPLTKDAEAWRIHASFGPEL